MDVDESTSAADEMPYRIHHFSVSPFRLLNESPPLLSSRNKKFIFDAIQRRMTLPSTTPDIEFSRYAAMPLPSTLEPPSSYTATNVIITPTILPFPRETPSSTMRWHINFADPLSLFGYYGGPLFAQDEHQVTEHPHCAALREHYVMRYPKDVDDVFACELRDGSCTPALIQNVPRLVNIDTTNLYGNRFVNASTDEVARAMTLIQPPTLTNIIAIAAPSGGYGAYDAETIRRLIITEMTGFKAAITQSRLAGADRVIIHTGNFGCGAFGGNIAIAALTQIVAARLAGVDELQYHSFDQKSLIEAQKGQAKLDEVWPQSASARPIDALIQSIVNLQWRWGTSNGT